MTPLASVRAYYGWIDSQKIDAVLALFRSDAVYNRAGSLIDGANALRAFFTDERKIRGAHTIYQTWAIDDVVMSKGLFRGTGAGGDYREVEFMDVWVFDDNGQVQRRETFLAHGHQFIRE